MGPPQKRRAKCTILVDEAPDGLEAVGESVSQLYGILDVKANHVSHMLSIEYDPDQITIEEIRKKIEDAQR